MKTLHWFRHDLRIDDNQAFIESHKNSSSLSCLYIIDPAWFERSAFGLSHMGSHRFNFILRSLKQLESLLDAYNISLYVLEGTSIDVLQQVILQNDIECLSVEDHKGFNEQKQISAIQNLMPEVTLRIGHSHYLYTEDELPFEIEDLPDTFSPFRRKVEKFCKVRRPLKLLNNDRFTKRQLDLNGLNQFAVRVNEDSEYNAGQVGATERINKYFFETNNVASYKETRNGLDGWHFSSRLSSYLTHGCISPARVCAYLAEYEKERVKNESTYWLFFELLWREFFHWSHYKHGSAYFSFGGIQNKTPETHFNDEKFKAWVYGNTGYEIVDACMRQLKETGFMSNRGRQLAASCLIHELGQDWRYGAAYFEQELIDFDVASNYGNWQYLAGVGSDPRGNRHFDLAKQTELYDPERQFIERWCKP